MLPSGRRRHLLVAVIVVLVPPLVAGVRVARSTWRPTGDWAFIALQTWDVPSHMPLYGVYSRFGFHHPGPLIFVAYALPLRLLGPSGLLVAAALVNAAVVVGCVIVLHRRGGLPLLIIGTLGLVVLEWAAAGELADPWNPWVPMFAFALGLLLAWSVWERDWWALPALIAVASWCVQAHLGYLLVVGWLLVVATGAVVASWVRRGDRPACPPLVAAVSTAVALALWSLPLWDLAHGDPGNLRLIVEHLGQGTDPKVGWAEAARLLGREVGVVPPALGGREPVRAFVGSVDGRSPWAVLPLAALLAAAAWVAARHRDGPPLRLLAVTSGGLLVGWVSVAQFEGGAYPYLVRWLWPLVVLGVVAAVWSLQRAAPASSSRWVAGAAGVAILLFAGAASIGAARSPLPAEAFSHAVDQLADPVASAVRERGTVLMTHQPPGWGEEEAGILAALEQQGVPLFVTDDDGFWYGAHRTIGDRAVDGVLVVAVGDEREARRAGAAPAGSELIASYDPLDAEERRDAEALRPLAREGFVQAVDGSSAPDPMTPEQRERLRRYDARGRPVDVYLDPPLDAGP